MRAAVAASHVTCQPVSVGRIIALLSESLEEEVYYASLHVSLLSAMSATGRILMGLTSDVLLRTFGIRRRKLLSACIAMMTIGMICALAIADVSYLWICTAITGFAYGGIFSVSPTIISERFGTANFGINWCARRLRKCGGAHA